MESGRGMLLTLYVSTMPFACVSTSRNPSGQYEMSVAKFDNAVSRPAVYVRVIEERSGSCGGAPQSMHIGYVMVAGRSRSLYAIDVVSCSTVNVPIREICVIVVVRSVFRPAASLYWYSCLTSYSASVVVSP